MKIKEAFLFFPLFLTIFAVCSSSEKDTKISPSFFLGRTNHKVVVHSNRMYLIGGDGGDYNYLNDVWNTEDGVSWLEKLRDNRMPSSTHFTRRAHHQAVSHNDKLYLIGGFYIDSFQRLNDVWSSSDGKLWVQETASAEFPARSGHQVVVYKDKLWLIGGVRDGDKVAHQEQKFNDVWSSSDGKLWVQETASAEFPARSGHQVVVYKDKLWLIGGVRGGNKVAHQEQKLNDVWSSSDGKLWVQETASAEFPARSGHQVVVYKDKLWLIGGVRGGNKVAHQEQKLNDAWSSSDGRLWIQESDSAVFLPLSHHQAVVFHNKIWILGGTHGKHKYNYVQSSADGITWKKEKYMVK